MNKKLLIFGIPISVLCLVLVSALLVPYISNIYSTTISVKLPIEINGNDNIDAFAEESVSTVLTYINLKNNITRGTINYFIINNEGVTCNEFNSIIVVRDNDPNPEDYIAVGRCYQEDVNTIRLSSVTAKSYEPSAWSVTNWDINQTHTTEIILNFKNVVGDYRIESKVMY